MEYDRAKELKAFDESKAGVKGLLDSGIKKVPRIFIRSQDELEDEKLNKISRMEFQVPLIDLSPLQGKTGHENIIEEALLASENWGFFQVVNHGIPLSVLDGMIAGTCAFHEQDQEAKKAFYTRDIQKRVRYTSNHDLFQTRAANWRDSLHVSMLLSDQIDPDELPQVCRSSIMEYINHVSNLANTIYELLSEALGLKPDYLNSIECAKGRNFVFHYYPECPEPDLTIGTATHTDPSFVTILLQDQLGGLQVMFKNHWVDVKPIAGALVINIGDLLQMTSNDRFKSVEHRVVANTNGPRVSVASFFFGAFQRLYGPLEELITKENPQLYKHFTGREFTSKLHSRPLGTAGVDLFKL